MFLIGGGEIWIGNSPDDLARIMLQQFQAVAMQAQAEAQALARGSRQLMIDPTKLRA